MGCLIWELLDGERTVDGMAVDLRDAVEDPPSDLTVVVVVFLGDLRERGLVL